jgi:hypothetical protein
MWWMLRRYWTIVGLVMPSNFRDKNGQDPFADETGENPFADEEEEVPAEVIEGPYATSAVAQDYRPEFDAVLPHRGRLWLWTSVIGLIMALAGLPLFFAYGVPLGLFALALTLPACLLAWKDHHAIRRGAMDPTGRAATWWAMFLGALGTVLGMANVVIFVLRIVLAIWLIT